ncbi:hypothetical protein [Actinotalea caeni]|uniref:hypothetical protein n=1 Tax=Actinotalea caeni TaxID=1348467 RepID=UPI001878BC27
MDDGVAILETEVRELIRRRGLDPAADSEATRVLIADAVADYDERAMLGRVPRLADLEEATKALHDAVVGLGPLQKYLDDPEIEEIWINEPGKVFVARSGRSELTTTILTDGQVRDLVERMLRTSGRRLDLSSPAMQQCYSAGRFALWFQRLRGDTLCARHAAHPRRAGRPPRHPRGARVCRLVSSAAQTCALALTPGPSPSPRHRRPRTGTHSA